MSHTNSSFAKSGFVSTPQTVGSGSSIASYPLSSQITEEHVSPTKHKVECAFREYERNCKDTEWVSWLGMFVGSLISLITSDFTNERFYISGGVWKGVVFAIVLGAFIFFVRSVYRRIKNRGKLKFGYFYSGLKERDDYGD